MGPNYGALEGWSLGGGIRGGAPIGAGGHDPPLFEAKEDGGHNLGIIHISHIALITPLH